MKGARVTDNCSAAAASSIDGSWSVGSQCPVIDKGAVGGATMCN
jgi:hypothetical protein